MENKKAIRVVGCRWLYLIRGGLGRIGDICLIKAFGYYSGGKERACGSAVAMVCPVYGYGHLSTFYKKVESWLLILLKSSGEMVSLW